LIAEPAETDVGLSKVKCERGLQANAKQHALTSGVRNWHLSYFLDARPDVTVFGGVGSSQQ